jgi:murein DD-endopeptidase MepM/ murein hydrolase activator NlpD
MSARRRTGVAAAIVCSLGIATATATAEPQTITVRLLGGQVLSITLDLPAGTPLGQILPSLDTPVISVQTSKPAAAPAPSSQVPATPGSKDTKKNKKKKHAAKALPQASTTGPLRKPAARRRRATRDAHADGSPTLANPTFSYALPGPAPIGVPNFYIDKFRIPPFLLSIYQAAGIQYGVRWEILAAINEIESDYGRNLSVSSAGARGWMQFLPSTWKYFGVDANNDGRKDPDNAVDAIFAAARYLRAAGADKDIRAAIYAYNHADWYVDSVLMRARLIGGLPVDLVSSLTGLTEGRFPVNGAATYAGGTNGSNIFAKPGTAVVAVQDGKVVRMGSSKALGRFVQLRDVYGNTFTYAGLGSIARYHAVVKASRAVSPATAALEPPAQDSAPTGPASAGSQATLRTTRAVVTKERLFAHPAQPARLPGGLSRYLASTAGLDAKHVRVVALRTGSTVIAGTILGRLGVTHRSIASHVNFRIRPAGKGTPLVDPKPILDGWKLLESTSIYRAAGRNPLLGADGRNPSIGQLLLMSKQVLERRVLADPSLDIYDCGRQDIRAGQIDRRVLATLEFLTASGLRPAVGTLRCGHSLMTTSGNVSEHSSGNAVDITAVNGIPIAGHQGPGTITDLTIRRLLTLQGTMRPHQIISLMTFQGADNTLALPDHADHIHVGFSALYDPSARTAFESVLKPDQWKRLITRLGSIANPAVAAARSGD